MVLNCWLGLKHNTAKRYFMKFHAGFACWSKAVGRGQSVIVEALAITPQGTLLNSQVLSEEELASKDHHVYKTSSVSSASVIQF